MGRKLIKSFLLLSFLTIFVGIAFTTLRGGSRIQLLKVSLHEFSDEEFALTLASINRALDSTSQDAGLQLAGKAQPLSIARRISLGLVGSGLSLEEIRTFESLPESEQIPWLTNYLLQDRRWADYFADRFSRAIVGTDDGPFLLFRRRRFNLWLSDQLQSGTGYDSIVQRILAAEGLWTDTPPVNFITSSMTDGSEGKCDPVVLTGRLSRTFLAQRIDCLQCHDDFLDQHNFGGTDQYVPGLQTHFHELAAFFGGTALPENVFVGVRELATPYSVQLLGSEDEVELTPTPPFLAELLPEEGKPRQRLAAWVTHPDNYAFARATVNRVWAILLSRPLVDPVDSIPLDDSVPPALDLLASDFANNGFDMRRLIRMIVSTDAFQRASTADFPITPEHENALAVFPISQLRPEQVAGSIIQSSRFSTVNASSSIVTRLISFTEQQDFLRAFGDRGDDEFDGDAITIAQRLVLMNGKLVSERSQPDFVVNAAGRISQMVTDNQRAIEVVYLAVLGRYPNDSERARIAEYLDDLSDDDRREAIGDLFWASMNSTEFTWNH